MTGRRSGVAIDADASQVLSTTLVVLVVSDASVGNTIIASFNLLAGVPAVPLIQNAIITYKNCSKSYHLPLWVAIVFHLVGCDKQIAKTRCPSVTTVRWSQVCPLLPHPCHNIKSRPFAKITPQIPQVNLHDSILQFKRPDSASFLQVYLTCKHPPANTLLHSMFLVCQRHSR